jgi:hypothetical protein
MIHDLKCFERITAYVVESGNSFFETAVFALGLSTVNMQLQRGRVMSHFGLTEGQLNWLNSKDRTVTEFVGFINMSHVYNEDGRDVNGFDREGYDIFGLDEQGLDRSGLSEYRHLQWAKT